MITKDSISRRGFLRTGLAGSAVLSAGLFPRVMPVSGSVTKSERDPFHDLKVGITSYTLRKFSLDEAVALTKKAGVKYISLKDMHLPMKSTLAQRQEVRRKVEAAGLNLVGGGVIYMNRNEEEIRAAFEYARDAGMPTIICSPDPSAMDMVEAMAKRFQIRVAIHNHGPGDKRYPSPLDVLKMVKDRDPLMGICMDVGHTVRIKEDPIEVISQCAPRLYDFHIKDVTEGSAKGEATEVGRGVIDIVGVLRALIGLHFPYHVALEYEAHGDDPMPGVIESFAYIRGVLAAV